MCCRRFGPDSDVHGGSFRRLGSRRGTIGWLSPHPGNCEFKFKSVRRRDQLTCRIPIHLLTSFSSTCEKQTFFGTIRFNCPVSLRRMLRGPSLGLSKEGKRMGLSFVSRNFVARRTGGFRGTGMNEWEFLQRNLHLLTKVPRHWLEDRGWLPLGLGGDWNLRGFGNAGLDRSGCSG